jgi:integrase
MTELIAHYREKELCEEGGKAHSTREVYGSYIRTWILPKWGQHFLSDVRTVDVEAWLGTLPLANGSKAKTRNVMSAIFSHAMRYEWLTRNPIALVCQSAKRERVPDVLTAKEIGALLAELADPSRTAVMLAACTGLRVSELLALKWSDVDFGKGEILPCRAIVDQVVGDMKTEASGKPLPMDGALANVLLDWRGRCPYNQDSDFLFGSPEMDGRQPYWPDSLLRKVIRPAAVRAKITAHIGWHTFRRTLATLLQSNAESVKVTQDMMRHATSRMTMDVYAQSIPADRRAAQKTVVDAVLKSQLFPDVPTEQQVSSQVIEKMVGTWGLEPQTSTVSR